MADATCVAFSSAHYLAGTPKHKSCPKLSYTPGSTDNSHDCYIKAQWRLATEQQRGWNCSKVCAARGEKCLGKVAMPSNTVRLRVCLATVRNHAGAGGHSCRHAQGTSLPLNRFLGALTWEYAGRNGGGREVRRGPPHRHGHRFRRSLQPGQSSNTARPCRFARRLAAAEARADPPRWLLPCCLLL